MAERGIKGRTRKFFNKMFELLLKGNLKQREQTGVQFRR